MDFTVLHLAKEYSVRVAEVTNKKKMKSEMPDRDIMSSSLRNRSRDAISDIECPMHVNWSYLSRPEKGDGIAKAHREVKVTSLLFEHNHNLNKKNSH